MMHGRRVRPARPAGVLSLLAAGSLLLSAVLTSTAGAQPGRTRADSTRADSTRADSTRADSTRAARARQGSAMAGRNRLSAIVVTADKRAQPIALVPHAITAISAAMVERHRVLQPTDLTALVPNLVFASAGIGSMGVASLRGINPTAGNSFEPAVATYVDGVFQADAAATNPALFDVERVEVLRGPQSTLYGRGALGGVVHIETRQPDGTWRGNALLEGGTPGRHQLQGSVEGAVVPARLFARVSALDTRRGAFFTNRLGGVDTPYDGRASRAVALRLVANVSAQLRAVVNSTLQHDHDAGILPFISDTLPRDRFVVSLNAPNRERRRIGSSSLHLRQTAGPVMLTAVTGLATVTRRSDAEGIDNDFTALPVLRNRYGWRGSGEDGYRSVTWSQEVRAERAAAGRVWWTLGAHGFAQRTYNGARIDVGAGTPVAPAFTSLVNDSVRVFGRALFGEVTVWTTPRWSITAGARTEVVGTGRTTRTDTRRVVQGRDSLVPGPLRAGEVVSTAHTWRVATLLRLDARTSAFATVSRGFRPGGLNVGLLAGADGREYGPEYLRNSEVGVRSVQAGGRLQLAATAYRLNWTAQQVGVLDTLTLQRLIENTGASTVHGAEAELQWQIATPWRLDLAAGVSRGRYDRLSVTRGHSTAALAGNRLPYAPAHTLMASLERSVAVQGRERALVRAEWRQLGTQWFDVENRVAQPTYGLLHASVLVHAGRMQVTVWGQNLTDTPHAVYGTTARGARVLPGDPRTAGVRIAAPFGAAHR